MKNIPVKETLQHENTLNLMIVLERKKKFHFSLCHINTIKIHNCHSSFIRFLLFFFLIRVH